MTITPYARTFTILITEDYEFHDDPTTETTDEEAVAQMRDALQDCFDRGLLIGQNFIVTQVEQGDRPFWDAWKEGIAADRNLSQC